ncbi:PREDICTED: galectin-1 [Elephantulus edwardii]|uniref:galectin-1 n=1 Tax=Elephantulus edwardii TaxID=28737 RepID=UPI0003F0A235|nr:PREDICTED: galectin-1 [Elephantulus edwardii]
MGAGVQVGDAPAQEALTSRALASNPGILCVQVMSIKEIQIKHGESIRLQGYVTSNPKSFTLNLGQDRNLLVLHFNPRFQESGGVIVCNSRSQGSWGIEHRESIFPFEADCSTEVFVTFDKSDLTIKLSDGYSFKFANRLGMEVITFIEVHGDFKVTGLSFE